ncbi:MAG: adenine-specific methyltransferase EcoRI family protein [Nanoarchaeota archaeon]|nr:adenine-specific methyltransferase EcoRI family protein [Nanoarchaeota archaeon]
MATKLFDNAKKSKKDEFYTQLSDIERELKHYKSQFKNKIVYCNCDDPYESNFFKFFASNFNNFQLKKLIATCYNGSPIVGSQLPLFDIKGLKKNSKEPFKIEINKVEDSNNDGAIDISDVEWLLKHDKNIATPLKQGGDFRSNECINLLKQADIVCTNPPFSLFREYITQLIEYNKKFLIIGNTNSLTYKDIFKLFKENKIRTGYTNFNVGMFFIVPSNWKHFHHIDENGNKIARVSTSCWFTNLDVEKHKTFIDLYKKYSSDKYPKYDNYDAINVDKVSDIPINYKGLIGVPITFLDKYNPEQFEIIALGIVGSIDFKSNKKMEILDKNGKPTGKFTMNAKGTLYRIYNPKIDKIPSFKNVKTGELYSSIYARVIIRNKKV